jgi:hypothetical protein
MDKRSKYILLNKLYLIKVSENKSKLKYYILNYDI